MKRGDMYPIYRPKLEGKKWTIEYQKHAKILTVSDGYAMVRFKGAFPFVVAVRNLEIWQEEYTATTH